MMADGERGDGTIVGTITLVGPGSPLVEVAQGDEFELRMLAVSPLERGRGIGATLTKAALEMARERGATRVVLSTMESMHTAHRLYERMGFQRREDLDWVVVDNLDGTTTRVAAGEGSRRCRPPVGLRLDPLTPTALTSPGCTRALPGAGRH
ncbi:hypothetical protein GCM10025876_07760 [Demequina litorisediminis]|uniref:N-acetyltransferase domain-containing protein n=1 Tax=Demequina litorisediminis TaxID=1849022 RepID=A0ABQ6I9N7_9MICO|nr:hypothetical protein GCM10025876_07760 [Demequina litorisediminis]